jgi:hypothetical protein
MTPSTAPKVVAVAVVPSQPTDSDHGVIAHLKARDDAPLQDVAYLVKIQFETMPPAASHTWGLYVNDLRIPKYWAYKDGIYFKVFDPNFFAEHDGEPIRFSLDGVEFIDTGKKLALPKAKTGKAKTGKAAAPAQLPLQADVLK